LLPSSGETNTVRQTRNRYHFSYSFVQDIYQSASDSKEKFGLFGQVGVSDGNPNVLDWNAIVGFGGTGLIKGSSTDRWGVGFYRQSISKHLKTALANVQYIKPSLATEKSSVLLGVRTSIRF
jgi:porin